MKRSIAAVRPFETGATIIAFAVFVGGYVGLLAWFKFFDLYHTEFSSRGAVVLAYNFFRALFVFYLFWMTYCAGDFLLRAALRRRVDDLNVVDDLALKFFAGAGVWHVALLFLGFLRLYTVPLAIGITIPVVVISFFDFWAVVQRVIQAWCVSAARYSLPIELVKWLLVGLAASAALLLFLAKGIYPGGGHDYFLHYFAYYRAVIDHAGLRPNEVWYQFFYSKGAGLYFLGVLLTDPLAPQLVTYCFVAVAGLVVYRLVLRFTASPLWPWVGVALFLGAYIYTPGRGEFMLNGGWGDFEKLHELNAALVIAILWMSASALADFKWTVAWVVGAAAAITAAVIINSPIAIYLSSVFCLLGGWFLLRGPRFRGLICFALAAVSAMVLCVMLAVNYFASGLIDDQGIQYFWHFADVEKLYEWGTLGLVMLLYRDRAAMGQANMPFSFEFIWVFLHFLRFYLFYPLVLGGVLVLLVAVVKRRPWLRWTLLPSENAHVAVFSSALLIFAIVGYEGRDQYISFFRFSSFVVPIVVASGVIVWAVSLDALVPSSKHSAWSALAPMLVVAAVGAATIKSFDGNSAPGHLTNTWRFAVGRMSIDQAYTTQLEAGRYPWGGIYPGARGAYGVVGPHTPIWSLHISAYCMLPDCNMLTFPAFTMGSKWDEVMFGAPEQAKAALQSAGINYFLFSKELVVLDPLVTSPLFAPDRIGRYFGILWTDGTTALLTWPGPGTQPFDELWVEAYRKAARGARSIDDLKGIFAGLRATLHPWHSFPLPW